MTSNGDRGTASRQKTLRDWAGGFSMAAILAAVVMALAGGPILTLSAEENMSGTAGGKDPVSAETDATVIKGAAGDCKVTASASASSSSSGGGTVTKESHESATGPCGSATASAKATSTGGSGEVDENAN